MNRLTVVTLLVCVLPGISAAKDKPAPNKTVVQHNAPLGVDYILSEYYLPVKGGGVFATVLTPKPYIARRLDGSKTQLQLALVYSGWSPPCCFLPIHIVVDGSDVFSANMDAVREGFGNTITGTVFNLAVPAEVMRKVAGGNEVWVTIPQFGEQRQLSIRLGPQQLATFKLIVETYDRVTGGRSDN